MKKRFHSMKFFFLKYKFYFILSFLILVAGFILSDVVYHKPRVPRTEEEFLETLATGEQLFNAHRFEEAREYLIYPANHGYPKAQFLLAQMYYHSWGVEQDLNQALEYYQKAATQIVQAKYMVASMAFRGETKSVPKGTATAMLIQAAYSGYKKAQNDLGIYYLMSADYEQAYYWLSLGGGGASERAKKALQTASENLTDYQRGLLDAEIKGFVARK